MTMRKLNSYLMKKYSFKIAALAILLLFIFSIVILEQQEKEPPYWHLGLQIESFDWDNNTGQIKANIRNLDEENITLSQIYVNGVLDNKISVIPYVLPPYHTVEIAISEVFPIIPKQITIEVHTENNFECTRLHSFIDFEMLRVYWNESTGKIKVLVSNTGEYPEINFKEIFVNGIVDEAASVNKMYIPASEAPSTYEKTYEISLSKIFAIKPTKIELKLVTVDGNSFELVSPFTGLMSISLLKWDEISGQIKFLVYVPSAYFLEKEQPITFDEIYVNGTLDKSALITRVYSETYEVTLSKKYLNCPLQVSVKVVADFGGFCEITNDNLL